MKKLLLLSRITERSNVGISQAIWLVTIDTIPPSVNIL